MGFEVANINGTIRIYDNQNKDIDYYNKSDVYVKADDGYVKILKLSDGAELLNAPYPEVTSPSSTDILDLVATIHGYISDEGQGGEILYGNVIIVTELSDFPTPVSNVITLENNTIYQVSGGVDIGANRLAMGTNSTLRGNSPAVDYITSTTTGALITATTDFRLFELGFQASSGTIFSLAGSGSEICLMVGVRFFGTGGLGSVADYDLFECNIGLFVGFSAGLTFSGSNGSLILIDTEFFQTSGTPTSINLGTATWNLIRLLGCSFTTVSGGTGLSVASSGANLNSGYIGQLNACAFYGAGTDISGYSPLDDEWAVASGTIGITPSDRFEPTGWGYYSDAETTPATQSLTTTYQKLQIDGGGVTLNTYLPSSIRGSNELWDTTNDRITPISVGDTYDIRLDLEITATGGGASSLYIQYDIGTGGSPSNVIVDQVIPFGKAAPFTISPTTQLYDLATFLANGCQIFIRTDTGTATLATRGILITRKSSGAI